MATDTALMVIDMQVAIVEDAYQKDAVVGRLAGLIARARAAGTPVVFVQHEEDEYPPMNHGAAGWQIDPALAPLPGELVIYKRVPDSFQETPLGEELAARGINRLIITGMQTEHCVNATCRRAVSEGYVVTLVTDGHTTMDTETLSAAQIIAQHNADLGQLGRPDRPVAVTPSAEVAL